MKLLCARVAGRTDPDLWSEGSIFTHRCYKCGELVVLSKSGQEALAKNAALPIICIECAVTAMDKALDAGKEIDVSAVPGAVEEAARYFKKKGLH